MHSGSKHMHHAVTYSYSFTFSLLLGTAAEVEKFNLLGRYYNGLDLLEPEVNNRVTGHRKKQLKNFDFNRG